MKNPVIHFTPSDARVEAEEGSSLLEIARRAGYTLQSECGGQGTCRRCKVQLLSGNVFLTDEPNLTAQEKKQNFVLACLARITEDLEVFVPPESELSFYPEAIPPVISPGEHPGKEILRSGYTLSPVVSIVNLVIPTPTIQNNASDYERLCSALDKNGFKAPYSTSIQILRILGTEIRRSNHTVNALVLSDQKAANILDIFTDDHPVYGLALDVGTTTVFARLINLESGEVAAESSDFNRQIPCGGDIIHRIVYSRKPGGLEKLQKAVQETVEGLIADILKKASIKRASVVTAAVAGNTTMQHLFLGIDPRNIREEPYVPVVTHFPIFRASEVGLGILPEAPVLFSPSVASYVGGDITAGLLAAGVHRSEKLTLYVDLGTNGEVALGNKDWLTACACSAGPAFEGAGVKCGMRALPGAIDRVAINSDTGDLLFSVIGGSIPKGICGSGLIDLLSELHTSGRINARGKLQLEADRQRIRRAGRKAEMILVSSQQTGGAGDIVITDADLDNLIRTKGAIFSGIMTLLKGVGLNTSEIERVVIAGGFGQTLNIENAIRIGMLPDLPRERYEYIGNGSLRGAGLALLSEPLRNELDRIARMITYFELSTWPGYMDEFMASLFLPHTDGNLFPSVKNLR